MHSQPNPSGYPARIVRILAVLAVLAVPSSTTSTAEAQGIGYAVAPGISYVKWHDALGLDEDYLYGGKLAFLLGPRVSLQPYYYFRDGLTADPTQAENADPFTGFAAREVDVRHFGADVQISMSDFGLVPFVRFGGGLLRLEPQGLERSDRITLKVGGGIRLGGNSNVRAELFAEDWAFRMDRGALYAPEEGAAPADPESNDLRHNLVLGAGVSVALGGGVGDPEWNPGGSGVTLEPFVGRLDYDSDSDLGDQNLAGARAGFDFNRYFGLRGFYWRAVNDDFDATEGLTGYGGEAQFNLGGGSGLSPFLLAGAARLDYDSDFPVAAPQEDRTALILGAGAMFSLSDNLRINFAARDYMFDRSGELEDVTNPDQLTHNLMYTAGLSFRVGGGPDRGATTRTARAPSTPTDRELAELEELRREHERLLMEDRIRMQEQMRAEERLRMQELEWQRRLRQPGDMHPAELREMLRALIREELRMMGRAPGEAVPREQTWDERDLDMLMQRLEERMELMMQRRMEGRPPAQQQMAPGQVQGVTAEQLERRLNAIEQRLADRIERLVERRALDERAQPRTDRIVVTELEAVQEPYRRSIQSWRPYIGVGFGESTQMLLGVRTDFGPLTPGSAFQLVPEVAFGIGDGGTSVLVAGNVQYAFGTFGGNNAITPYVEAGVGIFSETVLALNVGYGAAFDVQVGGRDLRAFVEHQGVNLFDYNRLLLGVRLDR